MQKNGNSNMDFLDQDLSPQASHQTQCRINKTPSPTESKTEINEEVSHFNESPTQKPQRPQGERRYHKFDADGLKVNLCSRYQNLQEYDCSEINNILEDAVDISLTLAGETFRKLWRPKELDNCKTQT